MTTIATRSTDPRVPDPDTGAPDGAHGIEISAAEWDHFVADRPGVDIQQSTAWARVKAPATTAHRVGLRDQRGAVVAGAQLLVRRFAPLVRIGYVPFGPIAANESDSLEVIERLERVGRRERLSAIIIQPARGSVVLGPTLVDRGYRRSSVDVGTTATVELDLDRPIEELRRGYRRSRRKNLKSARKHGVEVRMGGADAIAQFHDLHVASASRNGFSPMSRDYLERQCEELGVGRHIEIAIAWLDGEPAAAGLFTVFNGRIDFKMTGWTPTRASSSACPNDAIQDFMIEWAVASGQRVFDLGGLPRTHGDGLLDAERTGDRQAIDEQIEGTGTVFKIAWGGEVRMYEPAHARVLRPSGHLTYRLPAALLADDGFGGRIVNWLRRS